MRFRISKPHRLIAALPALASACGVKAPATADELAAATFALALEGSVGVTKVQTSEAFGGTACREGQYVLLLNPARKLTIRFPGVTEQETRFTLGKRDDQTTAHAFLNVPVEVNRGMSLSILNGSASVTGRSPTEAVGSIDGRLAQEYIDKDAQLQNASVHGVFKAGKCSYPREADRAP
jgi:hypothetical protein